MKAVWQMSLAEVLILDLLKHGLDLEGSTMYPALMLQ